MGDPACHPFIGTQFFNLKDDAPARDLDSHRLARIALLDLVDGDPLATELFHTFEGLWPAAVNFAALADEFARSCG